VSEIFAHRAVGLIHKRSSKSFDIFLGRIQLRWMLITRERSNRLFCHFIRRAVAGALASLRKAPLSFVMFICPHVEEMFQPDRFQYNLMLKICMKICPEKLRIYLSWDKWRRKYTLLYRLHEFLTKAFVWNIHYFMLLTLACTSAIHTDNIVAFAMLQSFSFTL
jgi:hypothetical protein